MNWKGPRRRASDLVLDIDVQGARQLKRENSGSGIDIYSSAEPAGSRRAVAGAVAGLRIGDRAPATEAAEEIRNYSQYDYVLVNREVRDFHGYAGVDR